MGAVKPPGSGAIPVGIPVLTVVARPLGGRVTLPPPGDVAPPEVVGCPNRAGPTTPGADRPPKPGVIVP